MVITGHLVLGWMEMKYWTVGLKLINSIRLSALRRIHKQNLYYLARTDRLHVSNPQA